MNISGIRGYAGYYNNVSSVYNKPESNQVASENLSLDSQTNSSGRPLEDFSTSLSTEDSIKGAESFANQFEPNAEHSLKGTDSDLSSLDETKSVANSQKQQIMAQYRMFVGSAQAVSNVAVASRPMEDFSL
ncbi:hypothetical protein [Eubacterium oxidoreducens]|uniref:Uncharacterized protein n=1 Tax=Eubacterium oxidoreducens TaxID=1732 RepID=A0A1G6BGS9_EUBOX|nr:hypothetical protein [Eubacterium oxidoreducens]SDB19825.1 hypothetical protein SAMN02910417_01496 [Eubacterium oxidoreducens]